MPHNPACFAAHMGLWCIDDAWFRQALFAVLHGLAPQSADGLKDAASMYGFDSDGIAVLDGGVAAIPIVGPMTKVGSAKFGESSTLQAQRRINAAARDPEVKTIMAFIDSPGGMFDGTDELARAFRTAGKRKRTVAHIEGLGASAAYYMASQADVININPTGRTGSIGVVGSVIDSSEAFELEGLKVHLYSTGPYKGMAWPGTAITPEMDEKFQAEVNEANQFFLNAVSAGRRGRMTRKEVNAAATGETYGADRALELGLVDQVSYFDDFLREVT